MPGYAIVHLSLKSTLAPPGDVTSEQMDAVADLADRFSMGRIVVTHRQNLVLTDVAVRDLREVHAALARLGFATPNVDRITDMITCPGLDYCDLANARSIPIAEDITRRFDDLDWVFDVGPLTLNISGCINACGHHHVGNIGILGIDKQGEEFYQLMLGGSGGVGVGGTEAALGRILGRALSAGEVGPAIERIVRTYVSLRTSEDETFIEAHRRLGAEPFKEAVYGAHSEKRAAE